MSIPGGLPRVVPSRATPRGVSASFLVLASDFQRTVLNLFHNHCLPFVFSGCKSTAFFNTRNIFLNYFENILHLADLQYYIFTYFTRKNLKQRQKCPFSHPKKHILPSVFDEKSIKTVQSHTKLCARKRTCFRHTLLI